VDNLRYTWQQLLAHAMETNCLLLSLQPHFADDLCRNLERFHRDTVQYCHDYRTSGPMVPGLTPREASDRLLLFQVWLSFVRVYVAYCFPHNSLPFQDCAGRASTGTQLTSPCYVRIVTW